MDATKINIKKCGPKLIVANLQPKINGQVITEINEIFSTQDYDKHLSIKPF